MPVDPLVEDYEPIGATFEEQISHLSYGLVPFGMAIFDIDGTLVRCNDTWNRFFEIYFGAGPGYAQPGRSIHDLIPDNQAAIEGLFAAVRQGKTVRQAAHRIAVPGVETFWDVIFAPLYKDGEIVAVVDIVSDATDRVLSRARLQGRIAAFARVARDMTVDADLASTLDRIRSEIVHTTDAVACSIVAWPSSLAGEPQLLTVADPAFGAGYDAAFATLFQSRDVNDAPSVDRGAYELIREYRDQALQRHDLVELHPYYLRSLPVWDDIALFPLVSGGTLFGELQVHLPAGARFTDDDAAYLIAMSDFTSLTIENASLFAQQAVLASSVERQRLARELHDSVSQALFSMTMHARTAERLLARLGPDADDVRGVVAELANLSRGALAEMRALIFELRPDALAEEGLIAALRKQATALSSREQIAIHVQTESERIVLAPRVEEHLYRIAMEALNNAIKHGSATVIDVVITQVSGILTLMVRDNGVGFDPTLQRPGHLGMTTMRDRAQSINATLRIHSRPGSGTTIEVLWEAASASGQLT